MRVTCAKKYVLYLRSSTIGTTVPRSLTLFPDISACCIRACSSTATSVVVAGVVIRAFNILHGLIIITARGASGDIGDFLFHVKLFTLQQRVHDLSQSDIPGAKPAQVSALVLGLGLQVEKIPLRARREFECVDAAICRGFARGFVGDEASIRGDHHQIQLGFSVGCASRAPAEVHQFIFGVEIEVTWGSLRLDDIGGLLCYVVSNVRTRRPKAKKRTGTVRKSD